MINEWLTSVLFLVYYFWSITITITITLKSQSSITITITITVKKVIITITITITITYYPMSDSGTCQAAPPPLHTYNYSYGLYNRENSKGYERPHHKLQRWKALSSYVNTDLQSNLNYCSHSTNYCWEVGYRVTYGHRYHAHQAIKE